MRQREDGVCFAYSKSDGCAFALPRSEYPRFLQEWMAGRAFWTGRSFYGSETTIKLGDIVAVVESDAESLRAGREDKAMDEQEDAIA